VVDLETAWYIDGDSLLASTSVLPVRPGGKCRTRRRQPARDSIHPNGAATTATVAADEQLDDGPRCALIQCFTD
jgi:hypothetical protein